MTPGQQTLRSKGDVIKGVNRHRVRRVPELGEPLRFLPRHGGVSGRASGKPERAVVGKSPEGSDRNVGSSYGQGQVYRGGKVTGKSSVVEGSIGFQFGGEAFGEIIFFEDKQTYFIHAKGKRGLEFVDVP